MIWLAFPALVILAVRLTIVLSNLLSRPYLSLHPSEDHSLVSVLIPARNEEKNLPALLEGLIGQHHVPLEILVYNDDSTDGTLEIIQKYASIHSHVSFLQGEALPEGWTGKNHACHQLAMRARGTYFLFLDADVKVEPDLIEKAVAFARNQDLTLLSLFPRQLMQSPGELLTVPVMNWILLSMLPLRLIRTSHYPSLSAANGQMMLFRAREYRQHNFHLLMKGINVEDIHIIRMVKRMGYVAQTLLSRGEISCKMYGSYREGIVGFSRSMFAFFGGSGPGMVLFTLFSTLGVVFVWMGMSPAMALAYLGSAALMRILIQILSRQPVLRVFLLSPLVQLSFVWMVIHSIRMKIRGTSIWKERTIQFKGI
jgi:chlorobactene glucosyltransferase